MSRFLVKIDRSTVRRNPNAGRSELFVPGRAHKQLDESGRVTSMTFDVIKLYHQPEPAFLYEYKNKVVQCDYCKACFSHDQVEEAFTTDGFLIDNVCPVCGTPECCEIIYEDLSHEELRSCLVES